MSKPLDENLGCWNAYVEGGKTKDAQLLRFKEVPEKLKRMVQSHMKLVIKLRMRSGCDES